MVWIEYGEYRGCTLNYSDTDPKLYWSPCVAGASYSHDALILDIDLTLGPVEPPEPEKKPTTLTIDVYPTTGTPPYQVTITTELTSNGTPLQYKTVVIYKNDVVKLIQSTDSSGKTEYVDTVTEKSSYYAYFAGDSEYEGCDSKAAGLGGVGLLFLLWLILSGGK